MKEIVEKINTELEVVNKNNDLMVSFESKIKNRINKMWQN